MLQLGLIVTFADACLDILEIVMNVLFLNRI